MSSTVTQLARRFRLSRTALLHYERIGLLRPSSRSAAGYRLYSEADGARLGEICRLRRAGLSLAAIARSLEAPQSLSEALRARLDELREEIAARRAQQRFIATLLRSDAVPTEPGALTKARWTALLRAAGFSHADMDRWHADFERSAPEEHQAFLEALGISAQEIEAIRGRSRKRHDPPKAR